MTCTNIDRNRSKDIHQQRHDRQHWRAHSGIDQRDAGSRKFRLPAVLGMGLVVVVGRTLFLSASACCSRSVVFSLSSEHCTIFSSRLFGLSSRCATAQCALAREPNSAPRSCCKRQCLPLWACRICLCRYRACRSTRPPISSYRSSRALHVRH